MTETPKPGLESRASSDRAQDRGESASRSNSSDDVVEVGYVARAHGVQGEVRVHTYDPASQCLLSVDRVGVGGEQFDVESARAVNAAILLRLAGVRDRSRAERLRGSAVHVAREALELDDDEVLLADLVGCRVELADGTAWGEVAAVELGPQDRLVVHHGELERLLPLVDAFVLSIDIAARLVIVEPPEDLPETSRP